MSVRQHATRHVRMSVGELPPVGGCCHSAARGRLFGMCRTDHGYVARAAVPGNPYMGRRLRAVPPSPVDTRPRPMAWLHLDVVRNLTFGTDDMLRGQRCASEV